MADIIVPFRQVSADHILKKVITFPEGIQGIEVWINDFKVTSLNENDVSEAFRKLRSAWQGTIVAVCKDKSEKGNWKRTAEEKLQLLAAAATQGADYVDLGIHHDAEDFQKLRSTIPESSNMIASFHDFKQTASSQELHKMSEKLKSTGADLIKIATIVKNAEDCERLLDLQKKLQEEGASFVVIGMGEQGLLTRVLGHKYGNAFDFVSLEGSTAPGQLSFQESLQHQQTFSS